MKFSKIRDFIRILAGDPDSAPNQQFTDAQVAEAYNNAAKEAVAKYGDYLYFIVKVQTIHPTTSVVINGQTWAKYALPSDYILLVAIEDDDTGIPGTIYLRSEARNNYELAVDIAPVCYIEGDYFYAAPATLGDMKIYYACTPTEMNPGVNDDTEPEFPLLLQYGLCYEAARSLLNRMNKSPQSAMLYKQLADFTWFIFINKVVSISIGGAK